MNPRHTLLQYSIGNAYASQGRTEEAVVEARSGSSRTLAPRGRTWTN